ncbi:MAG: S8 family serine peptidase [Blastocatellia bacterium]
MKHPTPYKRALLLALIVSLSMPGIAPAGVAGRQTLGDHRKQGGTSAAPKLAPDLLELLDGDEREIAAGKKGAPTLAGRRRDKTATRYRVAGMVLPSPEAAPDEKQSFIVRLGDAATPAALDARLAMLGGRVTQKYPGMGLVSIEAPRAALRRIAAEGALSYVSPDRPVAAMGHVDITTGATLVRKVISGVSNLNGAGVGVAIIDSGVADPHMAFAYWNKAEADFTGGGTPDDHFGHGTHVASLAAGVQDIWSGSYKGIAPNARIINLRTLDAWGFGAASRVISALDWCVTNKAAHNIRVINLSLGTMAKDSYRNDPLCLAARRAHNAGIVVVAAAGNDGKALLTGQKLYGGIHSPGIEPSVITVGASNTMGTDSRADDVIATFSSRGPTRGYFINGAGQRVYDDLIKPDLVAPGNRLVAAASSDNPRDSNTLLDLFPTLKASDNGDATYRMMYLSGTSMSAPQVAGAAALLIQANPALTPNLVKAILMYTAQPLKGFNMLEQGAGQLNVDGAVRVAKLVKTTMPTTAGAALLTASLPTQTSAIGGTTFKWSQGVITNWGFLHGSALLTAWQPVYANGALLADATAVSSGALIRVSGKTSTGVSLKAGAVRIDASGVLLADGVIIADGVLLSDGVIIGDGTVLADGVVMGDGTVLSDAFTRNASTFRSSSSFLGDNTASMPAAP